MSTVSSQATTITASASETTIVTADPNNGNGLVELVITSTIAVANTFTLRDATGGTTRAIFDYPAGAAVATVPFVVKFNPPLMQTKNSNWTIQATSATAASHILAVFAPQ